jgi:hypothetical protein
MRTYWSCIYAYIRQLRMGHRADEQEIVLEASPEILLRSSLDFHGIFLGRIRD